MPRSAEKTAAPSFVLVEPQLLLFWWRTAPRPLTNGQAVPPITRPPEEASAAQLAELARLMARRRLRERNYAGAPSVALWSPSSGRAVWDTGDPKRWRSISFMIDLFVFVFWSGVPPNQDREVCWLLRELVTN